MATINVLLFAIAREAVGTSTLQRTIPNEGISLTELLDGLGSDFPRLVPVLKMSRLVRNGSYVTNPRIRIQPGDEIAIHPPYSGG